MITTTLETAMEHFLRSARLGLNMPQTTGAQMHTVRPSAWKAAATVDVYRDAAASLVCFVATTGLLEQMRHALNDADGHSVAPEAFAAQIATNFFSILESFILQRPLIASLDEAFAQLSLQLGPAPDPRPIEVQRVSERSSAQHVDHTDASHFARAAAAAETKKDRSPYQWRVTPTRAYTPACDIEAKIKALVERREKL
jgi:hypothetical protein